jgi:hypothetical protein
MATWKALLADLRTDLKDTDAKPRWSDATLYLFAKDAIRAYSIDLPMTVYREKLTVASGAFALPNQCIGIISVESSEGVYLDRYEPKPGKKVRLSSAIISYYTSGGKLYLNLTPPTGTTILLTYKSIYDLPTTEDPISTAVVNIPMEDEEIIRLFVKAKVSEQMRLGQSSLDRFKPGSGSRDDNPLLPEHNELMREYHERIAQRLGGVIQLDRHGRFS